MKRHTLGRLAEWIALALLTIEGHRPRHRNWRGGGGELDLVVERGGEVVFVEVKARSRPGFGGAIAAVDAAKQRQLVRVSAAYRSTFDLWDRPSRFDIVTIERRARFPFWTIRHYRNAFSTDLGRTM